MIAQFCEQVWALDVDPEVATRFAVPANVDLRISDSAVVLAHLLDELDAAAVALNFVLIDADHSAASVRRDIEPVIHRLAPPREPTFIVMHDSGDPECRQGIDSADWTSSPYVHQVELDFEPGLIIEQLIRDDRGEVWGGLALAYLLPQPRTGTSWSPLARLQRSRLFSGAVGIRHPPPGGRWRNGE